MRITNRRKYHLMISQYIEYKFLQQLLLQCTSNMIFQPESTDCPQTQKFLHQSIRLQHNLQCFCIAGKSTKVKINMLIRSMGPISEEDMVSFILREKVDRQYLFLTMLFNFRTTQWTVTSANIGGMTGQVSLASRKTPTLYKSTA